MQERASDNGARVVERLLLLATFLLAAVPAALTIHAVPHDGEPSHEDIVTGYARAYDSGSPERIEELVIPGIDLFGAAADQVEANFGASMSVAAE